MVSYFGEEQRKMRGGYQCFFFFCWCSGFEPYIYYALSLLTKLSSINYQCLTTKSQEPLKKKKKRAERNEWGEGF